MLNTVSALRRLLRNAFFVTNRVNVIGLLQKGQGAGRLGQSRSGPPRIDEGPRNRQPKIRFVLFPECSVPQSPFFSLCSILTRRCCRYKWRSSSSRDDKCHTIRDLTVTTAAATVKLRRASGSEYGASCDVYLADRLRQAVA